ncbi:hypothetical protein OC845_000511 [Tilletia horrida]|nr:hypothetical protein OC845_000511 [Tilletia horrida]
MSLLLAPYNNAMRLGQGFNSYTQQICIDDAVLIDPQRDENVVNNSGLTMKMLAAQTGSISALAHIPGLVNADPTLPQSTASDGSSRPGPATVSFDTSTQIQKSTMLTKIGVQTSDQAGSGKNDSQQQPDGQPLRSKEQIRQQERDAVLNDAASLKAMSLDELIATLNDIKKKTDDGLASGTQDVRMKPGTQELAWSSQQAAGPGQIVTYSSRFVNKLSEITDEMSISGSLSIKYGGIGGSGSGAFMEAEKFYDSDLNFFVSVKVINQTINFKDASTFNPLRSCMKDQQKFNDTYGDSFISGFLEGGEFNALVCIKVHNESKKRDIQAEAKIAIGAGPVEVSAAGSLKLAEENIANNSETTIYVRWCGGGNIKPYDDEWTIDSVKAAASRFPSLVGLFPQRTYAVLTKYETLRSYMMLKPVKLSPLRYEVAQLYTNMLLDAYMEYKAIMKGIGSDIGDIQSGLKEIKTDDPVPALERPTSLVDAKLDFFAKTLEGLDDARRAIRNQMNIIIREVDALTDRPEIASDTKRKQPYIGPVTFKMLVPTVNVRGQRARPNASPMDMQRINELSDPKTAPVDTSDPDAPPLFNPNTTPLRLSAEEQAKVHDLEWASYGIGTSYQVSAPVGDPDMGSSGFCTLDFAQSGEVLSDVSLLVDGQGRLSSIALGYNNGLIVSFGKSTSQDDLDAVPEERKLLNIDPVGERIVSGKIQILEYKDSEQKPRQRVVGVSLSITESRKVEYMWKPPSPDVGNITVQQFGIPTSDLKLAGLWGRMQESDPDAGIVRLGFIWGSAIIPASDDPLNPGGRPKHITSLSNTFTPKTTETNEVRFPYQLLGVPRLLAAPHILRSSLKDSNDKVDCLQMSVTTSKITAVGLNIDVKTRTDKDGIFVNWMVLPEPESCATNDGELEFAGVQDGHSVEQDITFLRPFPDGKDLPVIQCWFTSLNVKPKDSPDGTIHIRVRVVPDTCTTKGARLVVEALDGTRVLENIKVGWLAHTKPSKANADLVSGSLTINDPGNNTNQTIKLESTLTDKPLSQFIGLNEIRAELKHPISFATKVMPETTGSELHMNVGPLGSSEVSVLGLSWVLAM